jgi:hypothetical protein
MEPRKGIAGSVLALAVVAALAPVATADLSDLVLAVTASNSRSTGTIEFFQSQGYWQGDTFYLEVNSTIPIEDPSGNTIATFGPATITSYVDPGGGRSNPQINLGFAMQAGTSTTQFEVTSGLLSINPPYVNPDGRASVGITVNDANGDGATLTGLGNGAFWTQYNGAIPGGTTFAEQIQGISVGDPFGQAQASEDSLWVPISDTVFDMNSRIHFTLTAGDTASGTSSFQIIPEPTAILLLLAGVGLVRRR